MSDIYHNLSFYHRLIRHVETMLDTPWYARRLAKLYFWYLTASHISWGDGIVLFRSQRSRFGNSFDSRFCQLLISLWALETTAKCIYSMVHGHLFTWYLSYLWFLQQCHTKIFLWGQRPRVFGTYLSGGTWWMMMCSTKTSHFRLPAHFD